MKLNPALKEVSDLFKECFDPQDEDLPKLLRIIEDVRLLKGEDAVAHIRDLKPVSKFFLVFALSIYGLQLEPQRAGSI